MQVEILGILAGECEDLDNDGFYTYYDNFTPSTEFLKMFPNFPNKKIKSFILDRGYSDDKYHFQIYEDDGNSLVFDAIVVIDKAHLVLQDLE